MDLQLAGKTVLVTGSHRGTGHIIARQFVREGATVILHALDETDPAPLLASSGAAALVCGNIASKSGSDKVINEVDKLGLTPDVLVNNYGTSGKGDWMDTTEEDWLDMYQKNTLSVTRMVQAFSGSMTAKGFGRIINLGTIGSTRPNKRMPHYYASKGALANMTVSLAKALSRSGITVNLVSPGLIRTPEVEAMYLAIARENGWGDSFDVAEARLTDQYFPNPVGRFATREEVADVVVFLASGKAAFINGQNIRVDGGAVDFV